MTFGDHYSPKSPLCIFLGGPPIIVNVELVFKFGTQSMNKKPSPILSLDQDLSCSETLQDWYTPWPASYA